MRDEKVASPQRYVASPQRYVASPQRYVALPKGEDKPDRKDRIDVKKKRGF